MFDLTTPWGWGPISMAAENGFLNGKITHYQVVHLLSWCYIKNKIIYQIHVFQLNQGNMTLYWRHRDGCISLVYLASASGSDASGILDF